MTKPDEKFHTAITTQAPDMGTGPLPVEPYISAEFFEKEREKIFRRAWLEVARVEELPNPGDYVVRQIEVLKTAVLLVRGKDGQVRGFHNVCTHRGMAVAICDKGNAQGFICNFHGWTFDLDGRLKGVPGEEYFAGLDRADYGLRPVATDIWNGFIFVHWEPQPKVGLREFLGGMGTQLDDYPFQRFNHIARYSARVKANWKTFIDAFHEAYHVMMVHRHTVPDACAGQENPYGLLSTARIYGPHHSGSVWVNPNHKPTPSETLAWKYGMSFAPGDMVDLPGLNPDKSANWWFDINVLFPNFFIDVGPGWYFTYNFWPVSVDESTWEMNIYQLDAESAGQKFAQEHTKVLLRDILYEDLSTLEFAQKAMGSGVLRHLPISEMEIAVRHQLHTVQEWGEPAMSETGFALPKGYEDLAWLADWALPTERQRHSKRIGTPLPEIQRVYDALLPRIEPMIAYLDQFPINDLPPAEANLMLLALVFVEVSPSVELLHSPTVPDGFEPSRFEVHF